MASSSTSTSHADNDNYVFDVFINHRGPDVKRTLATDLYHSLRKHELRVFLDEQELQEGENITPQIESAIRTASVHIAIFSAGYASSKWCLDELVLMVDCRSKSSSTIIPVFYGVEPAALRWTKDGNGVYAQALRELEKKKTDGQPRYDSSTIEKWRNALSVVAEIKGFDLKTYNSVKTGVLQRPEGQFLKDIVEGVLKNVKTPLHVSEYPKGLKEKLKDFEDTVLLQQESGKTRVIGIVGFGGVGKTTLAKEFFNSQRSNYKRSCFLFDIRENSLTTLQSYLLKDITQLNKQIRSTDEGKVKLRRYLSSSHSLIILDDVDHIQQLEALLLPAKDVLKTDSLILVTSRNEDVLTSYIPKSSIYRLTGLSPLHSRELFCSHAFGQPHPAEEFEEVAEEFLNTCHGVPLCIKVLGALLRGKNDLSHWEAQFRKISNILPDDIQRRLKISYDGLDKEEKQMFLDIACFFRGEDKDTVIRIWYVSGWEGSLGLWKLLNRCLVEVDNKNRLKMHDHLRDLGRDLAEKEPPECGLRLWRPTDDLFHKLSGQSPVRGIRMVHGNDPELSIENLAELAGTGLSSNMSRLRLLRAEGCFVEHLFSVWQLPQLIYLRWKNCLNSSLPLSIPIKNLEVLYIEGRNLKTLWRHQSLAPLQLRELYIRAPISNVPESIGQLKHLEKFALYESNLETLPNEFCDMHSLKHVGLKDCQNMTLLPDSLGNLRSLQSLDLQGCSALHMLPESVGSLTGLQSLNMSGCRTLQTLPDSVGNLTGLRSFNMSYCRTLHTLPDSVGNLTGLRSLNMSYCRTLQTLPDSVGTLTGLRSLNMSRCQTLQMLPDSVGNLTGLQSLNMTCCETLQMLPDSVGNLTGLQSLNMSGCETLQMLPDSVGNLTGLQSLNMSRCETLQTLPDSVGNLTGLQSLHMSDCKTLQTLLDSVGNLTGLQSLDMSFCKTLQTLSDSVGNLTGLQSLDMSCCKTLQTLPDSVGNLTGLQSLDMPGCETMQTLPESVGNLSGLQSLDMPFCYTMQTLPDSVGNLTGLQSICMSYCLTLQTLPDSVGNLTGLQTLNLDNCYALQTLPDSVGNLTGLQRLDLYNCSALQTLPDLVGKLTGLPRLDLHNCSALQTLPDSVGKLTNLRTLSLSGCSTLETLPDSVGNLMNLINLRLTGCSNLQMLPNVERLSSLRRLEVSQCPKLQWGAGVEEQLYQRLGDGFNGESGSLTEESEESE